MNHRQPYQLIVGDKEKAERMVAVRIRGGQDLGQLPLSVLVERLQEEIASRKGTA